MLVHLETPDIPPVPLRRNSLLARLLAVPPFSRVAILMRRWQLRSIVRNRNLIIQGFLEIVAGRKFNNVRKINVDVQPIRAITSLGASELSNHPFYAELFNDLASYHEGELLESEFSIRYGFSTQQAVDVAFEYLGSLDAQGLCFVSESTTVFEWHKLAFVVGFVASEPAFVAVGTMPFFVDTLFPEEFSSWTPSEPVWNRFDESELALN